MHLIRRPPIRIVAILMLASIVSISACSRGGRLEPPRYPVSGAVTLDGAPLPDGRVQFVTVSKGLIDSIPIKDGKFSGMATEGDRRVEFFVIKELPFAESGITPMPGQTPPDTVKLQVLPPHLNASSTFTATVTPSGPNQFTFELFTKTAASSAKSP
jgi:hypothetical protein